MDSEVKGKNTMMSNNNNSKSRRMWIKHKLEVNWFQTLKETFIQSLADH